MSNLTDKKRCKNCEQYHHKGKFLKGNNPDGLESRCIDCIHDKHGLFICHFCNENVYSYSQWVQHCKAKARWEKKQCGEITHSIDDNQNNNMNCDKTLDKRFKALCDHLEVEIVYECVDGKERVYAREKDSK